MNGVPRRCWVTTKGNVSSFLGAWKCLGAMRCWGTMNGVPRRCWGTTKGGVSRWLGAWKCLGARRCWGAIKGDTMRCWGSMKGARKGGNMKGAAGVIVLRGRKVVEPVGVGALKIGVPGGVGEPGCVLLPGGVGPPGGVRLLEDVGVPGR